MNLSAQMTNTQSILIVEDEKNLGSTLLAYLQRLGHQCAWAQSYREALALFNKQKPSIVLMDIELPDGNGLELARELSDDHHRFVLLFLSAQNDPEIKVEGLELGAQDYITKPFALKELVLRLDRILQMQPVLAKATTENTSEPPVVHGPLKIWFKRYEVEDAQGQVQLLGQKECAILQLLYNRRGEAVTRDEILEQIWGQDRFPSNRTVDNYIVKLRKWCETDHARHIDIQSIRSIGYKLVVNP